MRRCYLDTDWYWRVRYAPKFVERSRQRFPACQVPWCIGLVTAPDRVQTDVRRFKWDPVRKVQEIELIPVVVQKAVYCNIHAAHPDYRPRVKPRHRILPPGRFIVPPNVKWGRDQYGRLRSRRRA